MASEEMQAWLDRLQVADHKIGARNLILAGALAVGVLLLLAIAWGVYRSTVGTYAVIENVEIRQHPVRQGQLQLKFNVVSPGKVYCRRISGDVRIDLIDYFSQPGEVDRPWSWAYRPGKDIGVTLWYRNGLFPKTRTASCSTLGRADVVILIDTTGSTGRKELEEKCVLFSDELRKKAVAHRLALIGFGDANQGPWLDKHDFTSDVNRFLQSVRGVKTFAGGDPPDSALDALEEALLLPYDEKAIRRFYLVTDADYHEPTRSGATAEQIAAGLEEKKVLLRVFSRREHEADYARLLGEAGKFQEIEDFGRVLAQGCVF